MRLEGITAIFGIATAAFALFFKDTVDKNNLIFSLTVMSDLTIVLSISIRYLYEVKNYMTSSQKVYEYTQLKAEGDLVLKGDKAMAEQGWPQKGEIVVKNLSMRYRETMEPSVSNLSMTIQAGMKVGIVGRTGAGKSSIL